MRSPSVIISVLAHAAVICTAIIAPLTASDVLPAIQRPIAQYVRAFRHADIRLPAPAVQRTPMPRAGAPTTAPFGITPEKPQPPDSDGPAVPFETGGPPTTGLPADFGPGETLAPMLPPAPPPPPAPSPSKPVRVGGRIKTPARVGGIAPVYPPIAISARVEGDVMLEAIIGVDGLVQDLRVVQSVPLLDEAALASVRGWRYTPTLLNGVPVPVVMTVTVSFRLTR